MEEDYKNILGEDKKYNLLGQNATLEIALLDMSKDNIKSKYRDILRCSVKKQLMYLNNTAIYDIEIFGDNPKFIPVPPIRSYCKAKSIQQETFVNIIIGSKQMRISRLLFRFIADTGIVIDNTVTHINPFGYFFVDVDDFIKNKGIPKHLNEKYDNHIIQEFISIQNSFCRDKKREEYYINKQEAEEERNRYYKQEEPSYSSRYKPNYNKKEETKQAEKEPSFEDFLKFFNSFGHFKAKL